MLGSKDIFTREHIYPDMRKLNPFRQMKNWRTFQV